MDGYGGTRGAATARDGRRSVAARNPGGGQQPGRERPPPLAPRARPRAASRGSLTSRLRRFRREIVRRNRAASRAEVRRHSRTFAPPVVAQSARARGANDRGGISGGANEEVGHVSDQTTHARQAARAAHHAPRSREQRDVCTRTQQFLGEPTEYVLNQLIDTVLAKDKDFLAWRATHPESYVPPSVDASRRSDRAVRRPRIARDGARATRSPHHVAGRGVVPRMLTHGASMRVRAAGRDGGRPSCGRGGCTRYPVDADDPFLALDSRSQKPVRLPAADRTGTPRSGSRRRSSRRRSSRPSSRSIAYRYAGHVAHAALAAVSRARSRDRRPTLVLGESAFRARRCGRAPEPTWLTIPQRGLYTGVMILGAVGTGKTSACMYPYVDQLLRWRADDPRAEDRRPRPGSEGRLLPAGARDACRCAAARPTTSRSASTPASATTRCTTISIRTRSRTRSASLLNNLFGKSKEPFWQQAYTDLLKFVISLRRITDGLHHARGGVPLHHRRRH